MDNQYKLSALIQKKEFLLSTVAIHNKSLPLSKINLTEYWPLLRLEAEIKAVLYVIAKDGG